MEKLLEKKIEAFLHYAQAHSQETQDELVNFFTPNEIEKFAVVNGNISLFEKKELKKTVELPEGREENMDAFLFDGTDISIVNSSDSNKKRSSSSGGGSSNNNNNNNNG